jgi:hypothetical protein
MQALLDINDPDWQSFQEGDPEYLLRVCGESVRLYCGWHIYPSITETQAKLPIGSQGKIQVDSVYVTDVAEVAVQYNPDLDPTIMDPDMYTWHDYGVIEPIGQSYWGSLWYAGYYYNPGPTFLPVFNMGYAAVTLTHGYDTVPDPVKQVAYELASLSGMMKIGNVKEIASPGFRLMLSQNAGANLNVEQKNRLAPYRLPVVR